MKKMKKMKKIKTMKKTKKMKYMNTLKKMKKMKRLSGEKVILWWMLSSDKKYLVIKFFSYICGNFSWTFLENNLRDWLNSISTGLCV